MKHEAVIFDLDDTLFDRNGAQIMVVKLIVRRLSQVFDGHSIGSVTEAFMESDRLSVADFDAGASSDGLRQKRSKIFLQLLGIKEEYADVITEMYVRDYPRLNMPIEGAVPLVKELSMRFPVAVISNGLPDVQYEKIRAIGLHDIFSCIVLSEEVGIRKPDSRIFHHAADLLHMEPSECLYVGDSYANDIVGAKTAGMQTCWLSREPSERGNTGVEADLIVSDLTELMSIMNLK